MRGSQPMLWLRTRDAGRRPRDGLESLGRDSPPTHLAHPIAALGNPYQRGVHCGELLHDLIVNGNVGESFDGDARSLTDPLAKRNATARNGCTRSKRGCAAFEIVAQGLERSYEVVREGPFSIRLWTHATDCTTRGSVPAV
jgi:hypothetical protein